MYSSFGVLSYIPDRNPPVRKNDTAKTTGQWSGGQPPT
jgi:hypothetical protein